MEEFTVKIAVITGASSGMGLEFAKAIDAEETLDEIWLIARRRERLEDLAKELRTPARILPMDLGDAASFDEYKKLLEEEKPLVSTLCNVAGFGRFALFTETPLEVNLNMIDINDKALVAMTQLTLPYMKRGSRVINLDSLSAFQPVPYQCIYGSTKAFVLSFSRALNVSSSRAASGSWPSPPAGSRQSFSSTPSPTTAPSITTTSSGSPPTSSSRRSRTTRRARTSPSWATACAARCCSSSCCRTG